MQSHLMRPRESSAFSIHLQGLISTFSSMISILKWRLFYIIRHLFLPLARSPHFSSNGLLGMVYEFLQDYFVLDFWEWLQPIFPGMWVDWLKSCSIFNITFVFDILTFNIGKIVWKDVRPIALVR